MDCSKFEDLLSDYLEGAVGAPDAKSFAAHSLQCRACRALLDEVKIALTDCSAQQDIEPPVELETTLNRIAKEYRCLDCSSFEEIITEFLDGFVPASTYHRFEEHASACDHCSALLTDVVLAVAACHSVHTYEDYEVTEELIGRLQHLMPAPRRSLRRVLSAAAVSAANLLMPRATQGASWTFATASMLVFTTFGVLLFGFSDDRTVGGIYRQAHVKAAELYSQGADIYAQKEKVVARLQEVGSDIGEIWDTLGGEDRSESDKAKAGEDRSKQTPATSSPVESGQKQ
jgi:predicted anti-sigma-YlaC factor YlaD